MTEAEFTQIVRANRAWLKRKALQLTTSRSEADDLCQETFIRLWRYRERYVETQRITGWLAACLYNVFCNRYQRAKREREGLPQLTAEHITDSARSQRAEVDTLIDGSLSDETYRALMSLSKQFRDAIIEVDLKSATCTEAAKTLGIPLGTVMTRLHRGRKAMLKQLA